MLRIPPCTKFSVRLFGVLAAICVVTATQTTLLSAWTVTTPTESVAVISGIGDIRGEGIAVDAAGFIYTTGMFWETADFDPSTAGTSTLAAVPATIFDAYVAKYNKDGGLVWAKSFVGYDIRGFNVAVDGAGNVYATGWFADTITVGSGVGSITLTTAGGNDAYIVKLDSDGEPVWARRFGGTGSDTGLSIAADASGNVYASGLFVGAATFGSATSSVSALTAGGRASPFLLKIDETGNLVWARQFTDATGSAGGSLLSIAVDASGNVYGVGNFLGRDDPSDAFASTDDVMILKYDAAGDLQWWRKFVGAGFDTATGVAVDGTGNIYLAGTFAQGLTSFSGLNDADSTVVSLVGNEDVFIAKLGATGALLWAKAFASAGQFRTPSMTIDTTGNIYLAGEFTGTADFNVGGTGGQLTTAAVGAGFARDAFMAKLSTAGTFQWVQKFGATSLALSNAVAVGSDGTVMSIGSFGATVEFGSDGGTLLQSAGQGDAYIWKLAGAAAPPAANPPAGDPGRTGGQSSDTDGSDTDGSPGETSSDPGSQMPVAPVMIDGELPILEPGQVVVIEDGVAVDVEIRVEDDTDLVVDAPTFDVRFTGECVLGCVIDTTGGGSDSGSGDGSGGGSGGGRAVLTLEEDGSLTVDGSGFQPGSRIDVWILDGSVYLGRFTVAADGSFAGRVTLSGVIPGSVTLQLNGLSLQGALRSTNLGVTLHSAPSVATSLPATGGDMTRSWQLPILLILGGLLITATRRQRRA
jgi:hypothetical protein